MPISRNKIDIKRTFKRVINSVVLLKHRIELCNVLQWTTKQTEGRCLDEPYFNATIVCTFTSVTTCHFHISFLTSTEPVMWNFPTLTVIHGSIFSPWCVIRTQYENTLCQTLHHCVPLYNCTEAVHNTTMSVMSITTYMQFSYCTCRRNFLTIITIAGKQKFQDGDAWYTSTRYCHIVVLRAMILWSLVHGYQSQCHHLLAHRPVSFGSSNMLTGANTMP